MLLIADSGGTKTSWCLLDGAKSHRLDVETQGISPLHQSDEHIKAILTLELIDVLDKVEFGKGECLEVFFYGSGCVGDAKEHLAVMIAKILEQKLGMTGDRMTVCVESDLLGAARALCGNKKGIACILGTGANSCLYDGNEIVKNIPPLGYILGDEGSGAVLGKLFLNAMFKERLPEQLKEAFLSEMQLSYGDIINKVYRQPLANRFLASTSVFIRSRMEVYPELKKLVIGNFRDFFRNNVARYCQTTDANAAVMECHFIGSIAQTYDKELREAAAIEGFRVGRIQKSPLEGLIRFHDKKITNR